MYSQGGQVIDTSNAETLKIGQAFVGRLEEG